MCGRDDLVASRTTHGWQTRPTGLANRTVLEARLMQRTRDRRGGAGCAVLFIDLDRFKDINDSLGHKAGDLLLEEIAVRLRRSVRPDDTVARLGGDEFVVLADCSGGADSAASIADKLLAALSIPFRVGTETGSHSISPSASIGISLYPQDGDIAERLLQDADCALYSAKRDGRECYRFFHPDMRTSVRAA